MHQEIVKMNRILTLMANSEWFSSSLFSFLRIHDIIFMDITFTNHSIRHIWLQCPKVVYYDTITLTKTQTVDWCINRNILFKDVIIRTLRPLSNERIIQLGRQFVYLRKVFISACQYEKNISSGHDRYVNLFENCPFLETIILNTFELDATSKKGKQIKQRPTKEDIMWNSSNKLLLALSRLNLNNGIDTASNSCSQLSELNISISYEINDEALTTLLRSSYCKNLKHFMFNNAYGCTQPFTILPHLGLNCHFLESLELNGVTFSLTKLRPTELSLAALAIKVYNNSNNNNNNNNNNSSSTANSSHIINHNDVPDTSTKKIDGPDESKSSDIVEETALPLINNINEQRRYIDIFTFGCGQYLKSIDICNIHGLNGHLFVTSIGIHCPNLQVFKSDDFDWSIDYSNTGIQALLQGCPQLKVLELRQSDLGSAAFNRLADYCPLIEKLILELEKFQAETFLEISKLRDLRDFYFDVFDQEHFTDAVFANLFTHHPSISSSSDNSGSNESGLMNLSISGIQKVNEGDIITDNSFGTNSDNNNATDVVAVAGANGNIISNTSDDSSGGCCLLERINIMVDGQRITDFTIYAIANNCPRLKYIEIHDINSSIVHMSLEYLVDVCKDLIQIEGDNIELSEDIVEELRRRQREIMMID